MVDLYEHEAKNLFDSYGILTPKRVRVTNPDDAARAVMALPAMDVVIKAQVLAGKRGAAGAVRIVNKKDVKKETVAMLKTKVHGELPESVLLEEKISADREFYLAVTINAATRSRMILFSTQGGMDIEELARAKPHAIVRTAFDGPAIPGRLRAIIAHLPRSRELLGVVRRLIMLAVKEDAMLAEINPLALTLKGCIALDAKVTIDENALFRHPDYARRASELSRTEKKAKKAGLHYVDLDGDIAVIGNGAGLVMATLDMINAHGGQPANFLDVQGGTGADTMKKALGLCLSKSGVRGIFVNIFAGITDCEEIAEGIIAHKKKHRIRQPLVVRMTGRHEKSAKAMLKKNGVCLAETMDAGARMIIRKVNA